MVEGEGEEYLIPAARFKAEVEVPLDLAGLEAPPPRAAATLRLVWLETQMHAASALAMWEEVLRVPEVMVLALALPPERGSLPPI